MISIETNCSLLADMKKIKKHHGLISKWDMEILQAQHEEDKINLELFTEKIKLLKTKFNFSSIEEIDINSHFIDLYNCENYNA